MLTSALLVLALGQYPQHRLFLQPNLPSTNYAFFEFAPASGAGMGTACACTTPTGAKGETMTFTRAGDATCSKQGLATTGIANGDLVVCTANQPRVESSGGVLGLRVEGARTNSIIRSEELGNAAWVKQGSSPPVAPAVTADSAAAPSGSTTADLLAFPAVSAAATFSIAYATITGTAAPWTCSVFVRGASTSGTTYLAMTPNSATFNTAACSFVSTSWSRCSVTATLTAASWYIQVGVDLRDGAQVAQPAQDVLVWGAQCELGAYATSYIPTVASAATRNAESAYLTMPSTQVGSFAATVQVPYPSSAAVISNRRIVRTDVGGSDTNRYELYWASNATTTAGVVVGGVGGAIPTTALQAVPGTFRVVGWRSPGVTAAVIINGTQTTAADAQAAFPDMNRVYLGVYALSAGFELDGIVSQVQVDPSITRAR